MTVIRYGKSFRRDTSCLPTQPFVDHFLRWLTSSNSDCITDKWIGGELFESERWESYLNALFLEHRHLTLSPKKIASDIVVSPIFASTFISGTFIEKGVAFLEGKSVRDSLDEYRRKFFRVLMLDLCVWPPTQAINFALLHPRFRVAYVSTIQNLRPVRGGRRAATLNAICTRLGGLSNKEAEEKFRSEWLNAYQSSDPLSVLWKFVTWFDENYPSGRPMLLYPMLYKICTTFGCDDRYQHDERLLKFWILLTDNFPERGLAVFDFAYNQGSLRTMAKFYVKWSEMYDAFGNSNRAREILDLAFKNRAVPISTLHDAKNKLEMRLMRDTMLITQTADDSDHEEQDMEWEDESRESIVPSAPRKTFGRLRGVGDRSEAPMFRIARGSPGVIQSKVQVAMNDSFEIFTDDQPPAAPQTPTSSIPEWSTANEFADDPEYQALFGFFHAAPRPGCHLTITENLHDPRRCPTETSTQSTYPIYGDDFEVYDEKSQSSNGTSKLKVDVKKPKMCVEKKLIKSGISVEENYVNFIEQQSFEFPIIAN
ncbi:Mitotic checkpoint serine/threonine-protein kinase BUB1 beta [Aphelenchoides besseyi]|nr:Mitotic checkpoint serine/threonine-protein kinase BUB1 beta [Aphelenchoides besseyi]